MAYFMIRVVLHGGLAEHYADLHTRMKAGGASRTISGNDGAVYDLPDGNYFWSTNSELTYVRDEVKRVADLVRPDSSVLVTMGDSAWYLSLPPAQS